MSKMNYYTGFLKIYRLAGNKYNLSTLMFSTYSYSRSRNIFTCCNQGGGGIFTGSAPSMADIEDSEVSVLPSLTVREFYTKKSLRMSQTQMANSQFQVPRQMRMEGCFNKSIPIFKQV